ncbi:hypothetical protein [Kitasatospora sp. NPDC017646]|uniref:hypothetical protein n=1 Tax=Kitasatospora sp. NPDC017646 TaxID=3364024 RepID=UPI00378EEF4F
MTDKPHRPGGGDDDGSAGTPMERLLREAMNARTSLITAHDLRPAAPPRSRVRRLRPVYAVTVPLLGLAAAAAIGVVALHGSPVAKQDVPPPPAASLTTSPSPTPTPSATATDTPTTAATPTGDAETDVPLADDDTPSSPPTATSPASSYTFRGVKFRVPAGWKAVPVSADRVCVLSPGAPTDSQQNWSQTQCEPYGVLVVAYDSPDELEGGAWPTTDDLASGSGWGHQPNCPIWGRPYVPAGAYSAVGAPVRTRPAVAGKTADKTQWQVTCKPGDTFTAQLWGIGPDQVYVVANGLKADYQAGLQSIVDSLDVRGHKAPVASPPPARASADDIAVTISDGLGPGQQVSNKGVPVTFTVTYRNTGQNSYAQIQPLVYTDQYAGTPAGGAVDMNVGKLERQDGDHWTQLPTISPGGGMDYAMVDKAAWFPLAPGASRKVTYRLTLDPADGPGTMPVIARATLPYVGSPLVVLGAQTVPVTVVK